MNDDTQKDQNWDAQQMKFDFGEVDAPKKSAVASASGGFVVAASKWLRDYFAKPHRPAEQSLGTIDFSLGSPTQTKFPLEDRVDAPLGPGSYMLCATNEPMLDEPERETLKLEACPALEPHRRGRGMRKIVLNGPRKGLPDLHAAVLTFPARLLKYVNERFGGKGPEVYHRAHLDKGLYSRVTTNNLAKVTKNTALKFVIGLKLGRADAELLLKSASLLASLKNHPAPKPRPRPVRRFEQTSFGF